MGADLGIVKLLVGAFGPAIKMIGNAEKDAEKLQEKREENDLGHSESNDLKEAESKESIEKKRWFGTTKKVLFWLKVIVIVLFILVATGFCLDQYLLERYKSVHSVISSPDILVWVARPYLDSGEIVITPAPLSEQPKQAAEAFQRFSSTALRVPLPTELLFEVLSSRIPEWEMGFSDTGLRVVPQEPQSSAPSARIDGGAIVVDYQVLENSPDFIAKLSPKPSYAPVSTNVWGYMQQFQVADHVLETDGLSFFSGMEKYQPPSEKLNNKEINLQFDVHSIASPTNSVNGRFALGKMTINSSLRSMRSARVLPVNEEVFVSFSGGGPKKFWFRIIGEKDGKETFDTNQRPIWIVQCGEGRSTGGSGIVWSDQKLQVPYTRSRGEVGPESEVLLADGLVRHHAIYHKDTIPMVWASPNWDHTYIAIFALSGQGETDDGQRTVGLTSVGVTRLSFNPTRLTGVPVSSASE